MDLKQITNHLETIRKEITDARIKVLQNKHAGTIEKSLYEIEQKIFKLMMDIIKR